MLDRKNQTLEQEWLYWAEKFRLKAVVEYEHNNTSTCGFYNQDDEIVCRVTQSEFPYRGVTVDLCNKSYQKLSDALNGLITVEKCFCCGRKFDKSDDFGTPWSATCFYTHGNWGSTIIDGSRECIEIWVCDVCLTTKKDEVVGYDETRQNEIMQGQVGDEIMEWYNREGLFDA